MYPRIIDSAIAMNFEEMYSAKRLYRFVLQQSPVAMCSPGGGGGGGGVMSTAAGLAWAGGVLAGREPRLELLYWRLMVCCDSMAADTSATAASSPAAAAHSLHDVGAFLVCACFFGHTRWILLRQCEMTKY